MGRHGFPPISPLSAAYTVVKWTADHGRPPRCRECTGSNGLYWYMTYYKTFNETTWAGVLSSVFGLESSLGAPPVVSAPEVRKKKHCYNYPDCQAMIVDEGHHLRFCRRCRPTGHRPVDPAPEPVLTRAQLVRWGVGRSDWDELVEWEGGE